MDGHGFDLLTKRLALLVTRRQGFRTLLAGAGSAGLLGLEPEEAAACGGPGKGCQKGTQCCSGICLRGRKRKGKGRKKGRCDCSFPQEACNVGNDCCFSGSDCGDNGCDPGKHCCFGDGAECIDACECCSGFTCDFAGGGEFGVCVPCRALQESCNIGDFCCDTEFCSSNGSGPGTVCCLGQGGVCADDLDCCGSRRCSSRADNSCQTCNVLGEICTPNPNSCCDKDAKCFDNGCDESGNRCCLEDGGACETDCDCCEDHVCSGGTCHRSDD